MFRLLIAALMALALAACKPDAETAALLDAVTQSQGLEIRLPDGSVSAYPRR